MKVTITIHLANDEYGDSQGEATQQLARLLQNYAARLRASYPSLPSLNGDNIRDREGNVTGEVTVTSDDF